MYTDSFKQGEYAMHEGLGWLKGTACPHYNIRSEEFDEQMTKIYQNATSVCSISVTEIKNEPVIAYAMEDNAAIEITDGSVSRVISSGGRVYAFENGIKKEIII